MQATVSSDENQVVTTNVNRKRKQLANRLVPVGNFLDAKYFEEEYQPYASAASTNGELDPKTEPPQLVHIRKIMGAFAGGLFDTTSNPAGIDSFAFFHLLLADRSLTHGEKAMLYDEFVHPHRADSSMRKAIKEAQSDIGRKIEDDVQKLQIGQITWLEWWESMRLFFTRLISPRSRTPHILKVIEQSAKNNKKPRIVVIAETLYEVNRQMRRLKIVTGPVLDLMNKGAPITAGILGAVIAAILSIVTGGAFTAIHIGLSTLGGVSLLGIFGQLVVFTDDSILKESGLGMSPLKLNDLVLRKDALRNRLAQNAQRRIAETSDEHIHQLHRKYVEPENLT